MFHKEGAGVVVVVVVEKKLRQVVVLSWFGLEITIIQILKIFFLILLVSQVYQLCLSHKETVLGISKLPPKGENLSGSILHEEPALRISRPKDDYLYLKDSEYYIPIDKIFNSYSGQTLFGTGVAFHDLKDVMKFAKADNVLSLHLGWRTLEVNKIFENFYRLSQFPINCSEVIERGKYILFKEPDWGLFSALRDFTDFLMHGVHSSSNVLLVKSSVYRNNLDSFFNPLVKCTVDNAHLLNQHTRDYEWIRVYNKLILPTISSLSNTNDELWEIVCDEYAMFVYDSNGNILGTPCEVSIFFIRVTREF